MVLSMETVPLNCAFLFTIHVDLPAKSLNSRRLFSAEPRALRTQCLAFVVSNSELSTHSNVVVRADELWSAEKSADVAAGNPPALVGADHLVVVAAQDPGTDHRDRAVFDFIPFVTVDMHVGNYLGVVLVDHVDGDVGDIMSNEDRP